MSFFNFYLLLQTKRANRYVREAGIHPMVIYVLLIGVFAFVSLLLLEQVEHGQMIYVGLGVFVVSAIKPNERFLMQMAHRQVFWIRVFIGLILTVPFVLFLGFYGGYLEIGGLLVMTWLLSVKSFSPVFSSRVVPTPFAQRPFEFMIGFRRSYLVLVLSFTLSLVSVYVDNFNVGLFSLSVVLLLILGFYSYTEPRYYVWNFAGSAQQYLRQKLCFLLINTMILIVPICMVLFIGFSEMYLGVVAVVVLGLLYIILAMLIKYAYLHRGLDVLKSILFVCCLFMPPLLLVLIPLIYAKALKNVTSTLWSE
ncbi:hypothetical protein [Reichenbachiella sp. MSK19-1]|uniref:hypothetical protein n=1 Tax=Reichenbachiella sp. MSK19-1 TaxID=1897631 RepID=UPI000E6C3382|nr:hypothetical protein [Reichenbachiella sp. MSK19-1]RJE70421.1 hypothetical protein BGP76_10020 [Reichenbachiella sp. MSK19-1]